MLLLLPLPSTAAEGRQWTEGRGERESTQRRQADTYLAAQRVQGNVLGLFCRLQNKLRMNNKCKTADGEAEEAPGRRGTEKVAQPLPLRASVSKTWLAGRKPEQRGFHQAPSFPAVMGKKVMVRETSSE